METPITAYCIFPDDANPWGLIRKIDITALDVKEQLVMVRTTTPEFKRVSIKRVFWTFSDAKYALVAIMTARAEAALSETEAATRRQVSAEEYLKLANEFKEPN